MAENTYSFKPEDYDDIKTNHPQLYKNRSSGKAPNLELVNKETEGGGSSSDFFIVNLEETYDEEEDDYTYSLDKTNAEIYEAYTDGKICILNNYGTLAPLDEAEEDSAYFLDKGIVGLFPQYAVAEKKYTLKNNVLTMTQSGYGVSLNITIGCSLNAGVLTVEGEQTAEQIYILVELGHSVTFSWYEGTGTSRVHYSARAVACQARGTKDRAICAIMTGGKILNFVESDGRFTATIPTN